MPRSACLPYAGPASHRPVPTTAGMPNSRATMAAWQVRPPRLVTMAAARFMIGSQSGVVLSVTSTSPLLEFRHLRCGCDDVRPTGCRCGCQSRRPATSTGPLPLRLYSSDHVGSPSVKPPFLAGPATDRAAVGTVFRPLHVHRNRSSGSRAEMLLDHYRIICESQHFRIAEAEALLLFGCECRRCGSNRPRGSPPRVLRHRSA